MIQSFNYFSISKFEKIFEKHMNSNTYNFNEL